jgi:ATP-dependent Clp protease adaptor protein ClpS
MMYAASGGPNLEPSDDSGGTGTQTLPKPDLQEKTKHKKAPLYHVILHNDEVHTYQYVVIMLMQLFGKTAERAYQHAVEVDKTGITIVETTNRERAELKRDQIKAFGADPLLKASPGGMSASIEPAD